MSIEVPSKTIIDEIAFELFLNKYSNNKMTIWIFMLSHYQYHCQNYFYEQVIYELRKRKINRLYDNNIIR